MSKPMSTAVALGLLCGMAPSLLTASQANPSGQAFYFVQLNPDYATAVAETSETPIWLASIVEIWADSAPDPVEGFDPTSLTAIHALGLRSPSESEVVAVALGYQDGGEEQGEVDSGWNKRWSSWADPGYRLGSKIVTAGSGTFRRVIPGTVSVRCSVSLDYQAHWTPPWKGRWAWSIAETRTFQYSPTRTFRWDVDGRHSWGAGPWEPSSVHGVYH